MVAAISGIDASHLSTRQYFLGLMWMVHMDDYRIRYVVLACTVMVARCMAAVNGVELMNIHTMPRMLITPFKPDNACTPPPLILNYALQKWPNNNRS